MPNVLAGSTVIEFLEAWGIQVKGQRVKDVTIHLPLDDVITVEIERIPDINEEKLKAEIRKYYLVEKPKPKDNGKN